jgi:hypothetical protein
MAYRVIIAGSRNFNDFQKMCEVLDNFLRDKDEDVEIFVGGVKGADKLGEDYAHMRDITLKKFLPEWSKHGKASALRRNEVMGLQADACICFWGGSTGTAHMIQVAKRNHLSINIELFS